VTDKTGCKSVPESGAAIIFIEKRRSYLRAKQCIRIADLSVKDQQCFSHEDVCSAAGNAMMVQPALSAASFPARQK
jgi:hypothetical protein